MIAKKITLTFLLILSGLLAQAQALFSEGVITYKITISGKVPTPANEPSITETKNGTVSIQIKGDNFRQDIKLEDGYQHSQISNFATGKEIILQSINGLKYAIEINIKDKKKQGKYFGAILNMGNEVKSFAGNEAKSATITYTDKSTSTIYILTHYQLSHPEIFEPFPELKAIPAGYDLLMENGFSTHFELTQISKEPVDNAIFRVPVGYRIISQKEYEKLLR